MSDVSQPDLWMEIHNPEETADERYRHFFFSERDEVSDVEQFEQAMRENEDIVNRTPAETLEELERNEDELPQANMILWS